MFIIKYDSGSYDDFHSGVLFITKDENYAKAYCDKATNLLVKVKEYYQYLYDILDEDIESGNELGKTHVSLWCKYHRLGEVNQIFYETIEER